MTRVAVAGTAVITLVAAVTAALGLWRVAAVAAIALIAAAMLATLDLRRRVGALESQPARAERGGKDVARALEGQRHDQEELGKRLSSLVKNQTREVEALLQLYSRVQAREAMPPSGKWALNPQGLLHLYTLVQRHRPKVVVELGSGTSTVWLGHALAATRSGRLVSVDHHADYAGESVAMVELHRAEMAPTEVRVAPLTSVKVGNEQYRWYDPDVFGDIDRIDMLVVDGPPARTGKQARYPAVPVFLDKLADGAVIVLDDATRADERHILERWQAEVPGLIRERTTVARQAVLRYAPGHDGQGR